jgi:hypothetical protein
MDSEIRAFARRHGLGLSPAIRLLVGRGLQSEALASTPPQDSAAALAALTAAEHALLMVASVLPEGQRRMLELGALAAAAAEERLALFKEAGQ